VRGLPGDVRAADYGLVSDDVPSAARRDGAGWAASGPRAITVARGRPVVSEGWLLAEAAALIGCCAAPRVIRGVAGTVAAALAGNLVDLRGSVLE